MKIKQIELQGVRIVEFEPCYAASVADMWNASAEGWNGEDWNMNEQRVISEETSGDYISLYLVVDEQDTVLGYCKLEEYQDKKAVYVPLLNVIPASYGKKYGKALLLKTLEKAVNMGYNRLDLHSWSGNTRAVPLYKKIGFRWQTSIASMYMMNYLPMLMKLKIIKPYFSRLDWYNDCKCNLSLIPDGVMDNGFEFFHYCWEKDGIYLEADFNADAKGLHRLSCNDFEIRLSAKAHEVFYGIREIMLDLENRTEEALQIEINLSGEVGIAADEKRVIVLTEKSREIFTVEIKDDVKDKGKTKPAVIADVKINGKPVPLKLGLEPQPQVNIILIVENNRIYQPGKIHLYLQLKNNLEKPVHLCTELIETTELCFPDKEIDLDLQVREVRVIELEAEFIKGCFYDQNLSVKVNSSDDAVIYQQRLRCQVPDMDTIIYGENKDHWFMRKANISLCYNKERSHTPVFLTVNETSFWLFFRAPQLSAPLDKEFTNIEPSAVNFLEEADHIIMHIMYISRNGKFRLSQLLRFQPDLVIRHDWEIENISTEIQQIDYLETSFDMSATHGYYDNRIIEMTANEKDQNWLRLNPEKVHKGWLYYAYEGLTAALIWDQKKQLHFREWCQRIIYEVGELAPGEKKKINGEVVMLNVFRKWQDLYSWYYGEKNYPPVSGLREFEINKGNPFCDKEVEVSFTDIIDSKEKRELRLLTDNQQVITATFSSGKWERNIHFSREVKLELENATELHSYSQVLFRKCPKEMINLQTESEGRKIFTLQSDKLEIKAAPEFMNGIFSLKYMGQELMSSSFPDAYARGWDNLWTGGMRMRPCRISSALLREQKAQMETISRKDNFGNTWQGFSFIIKYDKSIISLNNAVIRYNCLVSPSQDVFAFFCDFLTTGGAYIPSFYSETCMYFNEKIPQRIHCSNKILMISHMSNRESDLNLVISELTGQSLFLNFYAAKKGLSVSLFNQLGSVSCYTHTDDIKPEAGIASDPMFMILADRKMKVSELGILDHLRWS